MLRTFNRRSSWGMSFIAALATLCAVDATVVLRAVALRPSRITLTVTGSANPAHRIDAFHPIAAEITAIAAPRCASTGASDIGVYNSTHVRRAPLLGTRSVVTRPAHSERRNTPVRAENRFGVRVSGAGSSEQHSRAVARIPITEIHAVGKSTHIAERPNTRNVS